MSNKFFNVFGQIPHLNPYIYIYLFPFIRFLGRSLQGRLFEGAQRQGEAQREVSGTGEEV